MLHELPENPPQRTLRRCSLKWALRGQARNEMRLGAAYENAQLMPKYGAEMLWIQPPVKRNLQDSSAWVNMLHGVDQKHAVEWQTPTQQEELENLWRNND